MPAYKMITLSEKELGRIAANANAHADTIAEDLTVRWRASLPKGQKVIDIRQLQLCVRDDLRNLRREISVIERRHVAQLVTDRLSREARDQSVPQLRVQMIAVKAIFDGSFGPGTSLKVFGEPDLVIPVDPFPLRRIGFLVRDNLMDPELVLPPMQVSGVTIAPLDLAKGFSPPLEKLDRVLLDLEETLPITNATLESKIWKLKEMRRQAGVCARFLEALYYLANHEEIAKRVRISTHGPQTGDAESGPDDAGGAGALPAQEAPSAEPEGEPSAVMVDTAADAGEEEQAALARAA